MTDAEKAAMLKAIEDAKIAAQKRENEENQKKYNNFQPDQVKNEPQEKEFSPTGNKNEREVLPIIKIEELKSPAEAKESAPEDHKGTYNPDLINTGATSLDIDVSKLSRPTPSPTLAHAQSPAPLEVPHRPPMHLPPIHLPTVPAIPKVRKPLHFWRFFGYFTLVFIVLLILSFVVINIYSIKSIGNYYVQQATKQTPPLAVTSPPFNPSAEAHLVIPKLNVNAPIAWNTPDNEIDQKLLSGVAHYKGTALPGELGNVFITGHSSYYSWVKSDYKSVFALLDKLKVDDIIYIQYKNATYTYKISGTQVVSPDRVDVMNSSGKAVLTLMTCVPVGTNLRRLIVSAPQVGATGLF